MSSYDDQKEGESKPWAVFPPSNVKDRGAFQRGQEIARMREQDDWRRKEQARKDKGK